MGLKNEFKNEMGKTGFSFGNTLTKVIKINSRKPTQNKIKLRVKLKLRVK